jgi:hypothetical protein
MNKYDVFNLRSLIKHIQEDALRMQDPDYKKKITSTTMRRRVNDLREMKNSAMERLKVLDRLSVEYFPKDIIVEYHHPKYRELVKEPKDAVVVGHDKDGVIIQEIGVEVQMVVDPQYLKIKYLRHSYAL